MHQIFNSNSHSDSGTPRVPRLLLVSRQPSALGHLWSAADAACWEFEIAGSGCEALECVHAASPDLVLPDLVLLDLAAGGDESLYALRWLRRVRPDLPVVLLATQENAAQRMEALRLGAQEYLVGPVDADRLRALVEESTGRNRTFDSSAYDAANESKQPDHSSTPAETRPPAATPAEKGPGSFFLAAGPSADKLRAQAKLLAEVDVPVLLVGESGSGKEGAARLIHSLSARAAFGFYHVHCAALGGDLLERDLLGYEAGAFPGALRSKPGKLELAEKGTILLDDISETPLHLQAKLLHLLQEREFFRLGGESGREANVRIMAATSANLEQALAGKRLREDLYYRLSAFTVHVPPLRQRRGEIPQLLERFMRELARQYGLPPRCFPPALLEACLAYSWPGNLRELEGVVKRYLVLGDEELIRADLRRREAAVVAIAATHERRSQSSLPADRAQAEQEHEEHEEQEGQEEQEEPSPVRNREDSARLREPDAAGPRAVSPISVHAKAGSANRGSANRVSANRGGANQDARFSPEAILPAGLRSLVESVKGEAEKRAISAALERTRWNRKAAARLLGVSYRTLLYKIQQYRMTPPEIFPQPLPSAPCGGEIARGRENNGREISGNEGD